jgi:hypothetical protein
MAQDADRGLMIWDGKSSGTMYNKKNMVKLNKPFTFLENINILPDVFTRYVEAGKQMNKSIFSLY